MITKPAPDTNTFKGLTITYSGGFDSPYRMVIELEMVSVLTDSDLSAIIAILDARAQAEYPGLTINREVRFDYTSYDSASTLVQV